MITEHTTTEAAQIIAAQGGCNGIACCDCPFYDADCPSSPEAMRAAAVAWLAEHRRRKRAAA
mgnify:CR=1 FL=1